MRSRACSGSLPRRSSGWKALSTTSIAPSLTIISRHVAVSAGDRGRCVCAGDNTRWALWRLTPSVLCARVSAHICSASSLQVIKKYMRFPKRNRIRLLAVYYVIEGTGTRRPSTDSMHSRFPPLFLWFQPCLTIPPFLCRFWIRWQSSPLSLSSARHALGVGCSADDGGTSSAEGLRAGLQERQVLSVGLVLVRRRVLAIGCDLVTGEEKRATCSQSATDRSQCDDFLAIAHGSPGRWAFHEPTADEEKEAEEKLAARDAEVVRALPLLPWLAGVFAGENCLCVCCATMSLKMLTTGRGQPTLSCVQDTTRAKVVFDDRRLSMILSGVLEDERRRRARAAATGTGLAPSLAPGKKSRTGAARTGLGGAGSGGTDASAAESKSRKRTAGEDGASSAKRQKIAGS